MNGIVMRRFGQKTVAEKAGLGEKTRIAEQIGVGKEAKSSEKAGSWKRAEIRPPVFHVVFAALFAFLAGCLGPLSGGPPSEEAAGRLPDNWQAIAAAAIKPQFSEGQPKMFFLGYPKPANVRYRYWTEQRMVGRAGLAALKAKEGRGRILGPDGPWFVLYVFGVDGEVAFITDNLESADVDPPVYAMEVVDQTKSVEIRLPRPLGLGRAGFKRLGEFTRAPWETLPEYQ